MVTWTYYAGFRFHAAIEIELAFKNVREYEDEFITFDVFSIYYSNLKNKMALEDIINYQTINFDFLETDNYADQSLHIFTFIMGVKFFGRFISNYQELSEPDGPESRVRIDLLYD